MGILNKLALFALNTDASAETEKVAETAEKISQDIIINIGRFPNTLKHMGIGMLSIFLVIGVIILAVFALNKIMTALEARKKAK